MTNPIINTAIKVMPDKLQVQWGMTIEDKKLLWAHDNLELRLYCDPPLTLTNCQPTTDLFPTDKSSSMEASVSLFGVGGFSGGKSEDRKRFFASPMAEDEDGHYYPVRIDVSDFEILDASAIYPAITWTPVDSDWLDSDFQVSVVMGRTVDGKFKILYRPDPYKHDSDDIVRTTPPTDITHPTKIFKADELYVFISYARPQQPIAEQIEAFLKSAGVKVFRDTSDIHKGANWDMTIEKALKQSHRMVLLLSDASMPYRKEVHREWFYFDQKQKPIYPIYIEDCELHTRMYAYNYIDAREDLQTALDYLLTELQRDFDRPDSITGADKVGVFEGVETEERTLPEAMQALLDAIQTPDGGVVFSVPQATEIKDHKPKDSTEYYLGRVAEWSLPRYQLDNRFVNLTLLLDKGEDAQQRWQAEGFRFNDLRDVLSKVDDPALVLLGAPGSGKSTLLRRLQLDHSMDQIRDETHQVSFFIQLNGHRAHDGKIPTPRDWLNSHWKQRYPNLPSLDTYLQDGKVLLLLDALNEIPHSSTQEYRQRVEYWRTLTQEVIQAGNRVLFSCRSLDYSSTLSSPDLRVPQIEVQPMDDEQVRRFLNVYTPAHENLIWNELEGSPQLKLFRTPYFLKLLCEQVEATREIPKGRASLFTGFVRQTLARELHRELFRPNTLLSDRDHRKLSLKAWRNPFDLPERGILIPRLSHLAFTMQEQGLESEGAQVRIDYDDACDLIDHERDEDILKAGVSLNVLDEDITQSEIIFFHQLLQEFFAARELSKTPNPDLVHVEWQADKVSPSLDDTIASLADGDPLPALPQTGWEETTLTAAPMAKKPEDFIRNLIDHNLALAARCASSAEISISEDLKQDIQQRLINRTQDMTADLRARISAGLALGELGDPRFERKTGQYGDYLLPPMIDIPADTYPIGDDNGQYDRERPAHTIDLEAFQIGQFPVTNAEYALFMEAKGYEDEQWWDTDEALAWLRGEGSTEGQKQTWRDNKRTIESWPDGHIDSLVTENKITTEQANQWRAIRDMTDEQLEKELEEAFPAGTTYRQPGFWNDSHFNNPTQPVVGVTWFECRAYCNWLSAQSKQTYRLPSEVEFEASARGTEGRQYPYGETFDVTRSNTFESHIRRTTPIGIFNNATPEGAYDLTGNAYTWTRSIFAEHLPYPYNNIKEREDVNRTNVSRVLRGGGWASLSSAARSAIRFCLLANLRVDYYGFRVCASPFSVGFTDH
jgi:formylglycine-generating enzyme required for sulfatase activity